jgi:hypothetical protein
MTLQDFEQLFLALGAAPVELSAADAQVYSALYGIPSGLAQIDMNTLQGRSCRLPDP